MVFWKKVLTPVGHGFFAQFSLKSHQPMVVDITVAEEA